MKSWNNGAGNGTVRVVCAAALAAACGWSTAPAWAALGLDASSAASDGLPSTQVHAMRESGGTLVTQTRVTTVAGVTVREFSGADGVVFAIAWSGPTIPDLQQLYGSYFSVYRSARQARTGAGYRSAVRVRGTRLVAHASGHMRAYAGSAYVPALVPPGVDLAALGVQP